MARGLRVAAALLALGLGMAAAAELSREAVNEAEFEEGAALAEGQSPLVLKAQVLLDRAGVSPGVIDGILGENVEKAVRAFETLQGLEADGKLDAETWAKLEEAAGGEALVEYTISEDDVDGPFVEEIPEDYAKKAEMECQCYTGPAELLAEKFHMDIDLLRQLNEGADFGKVGTTITVANVEGGETPEKVARLEADKALGQVRGYDSEDKLVVAYPATIGSEENPSPSGTHEVRTVATDAAYYYRPDVNFQQGDNTEPLTIPPGPNNPIGTVWIDLTEPTYGIHGTPEPEKIDKTQSHGCVRLTNWDAEELAELVEPGVPVAFVE
jgi:lipoprotein-anchoring transpeptidase ErfK/SrfK